ncbi:MAG: glutamate-5-semialdehyde dehydrogenase [Sandaracinus sp.]|nr:glutamate-5-semialdehyde dehydrogenase [Sandaracinus sp.]MCB9632597.1 glutamate-5-semialdehyde dehydrogenase [Sandaracinus sp.]
MQDVDQELVAEVRALAQRAREASRVLASATTAQKDAVLLRVAALLDGPAADEILAANAKDLVAAEAAGLAPALVDRLRLDAKGLAGVADGVRAIVDLPDPVGDVVHDRTLPNGLRVQRVRAPLGVIGIVYEARPNVTIDAAALCLKSGNAVILRGGKEAFESNAALAKLVGEALRAEGLPEAAVSTLGTIDRRATLALIQASGLVDVVIPRGGEGLIRFVTENAKVPVIQHFKGVCHVYVADDADLDMAMAIVRNAKVQRPSACNALETLLVDAAVAERFLPAMAEALSEVALRGCERTCALVPRATPATEEDWDTEHLSLVLNVRVVEGLDAALTHIARHGSLHTEAIVTRDKAKGQRFVREVDASLVLVNASTRFNDGYQLGLGAEMGISTSKLHAYGPMGLEELCTLRWVAHGEGQIRK